MVSEYLFSVRVSIYPFLHSSVSILASRISVTKLVMTVPVVHIISYHIPSYSPLVRFCEC